MLRCALTRTNTTEATCYKTPSPQCRLIGKGMSSSFLVFQRSTLNLQDLGGHIPREIWTTRAPRSPAMVPPPPHHLRDHHDADISSVETAWPIREVTARGKHRSTSRNHTPLPPLKTTSTTTTTTTTTITITTITTTGSSNQDNTGRR